MDEVRDEIIRITQNTDKYSVLGDFYRKDHPILEC